MKKFFKLDALQLLTASVGVVAASFMVLPSAQAMSLNEAISQGQPSVDVRLRYESVDQENKDDQASAVSARTRIGYATQSYRSASTYFEFENITALRDDYEPLPAKGAISRYPVVADPEGSEVNQAFLSYSKADLLTVKAGRQRIIYDNARFVGNVGWRQNEQTYDGLSLSAQPLKKLSLNYAYVTQVNSIIATAMEMESHLLSIHYQGLSLGTLTAFSYLLDYDEGTDSQTLGGSYGGKAKISETLETMFTLAFAQMSDYADNDSGDSADYLFAEAGVKASGVTAKLGYEVLSGDGSTAFQTPLATKHKFNGWADKFLVTPADGLVDTFVTVAGKLGGARLMAVYHAYASDAGSTDYGSELDLLVARQFAKIYRAGVKAAMYTADDHSVDTTKLWLWGGITF